MILKIIFICLLILFCSGVKQDDEQQQQEQIYDPVITVITDPVKIPEPQRRDCTTNFSTSITARGLYVNGDCLFGKLDSSAPIQVSKGIKTQHLEAHKLSTPSLHVRTLYPLQEGQAIVINGSLVVEKVHLSESLNQNFEVTLIEKQSQFWKLSHHLNFDKDDDPLVSECDKLIGGKFFGGPCLNEAQFITKHFPNITSHTQVKIELSLHLFDNWEDEVILISANDELIYQNRFTNSIESLSICGNDKYGEDNLNIKVEKIINHNLPDLILKVQALMNKHPCEASFGIDNLIIYIK